MGCFIYILLLFIGTSVQAADKTVVLSTRGYENPNSLKLLDQIPENDTNLYFIASVNVEGDTRGLDLERATYDTLGLGNFQSYDENCDTLHDTLNKTFERLGFKFVEADENLEETKSGLWFYLPPLTNTSLVAFKKLVQDNKTNKAVTLLVTNCALLRTKEAMRARAPEKEEEEEEIRTTPIIFQQIALVLVFILVTMFGVFFALNVKTPSSLLTPQHVKTKTI